MSSNQDTHCQINGSVAPGFEPVKQQFEYDMRTMIEKQAQLCVYYRGEKVVDLWASTTPGNSFTADTLINVFSSGKSLEAVAVAALVNKGLLSYDDKIVTYWPEFAANGKEGLSVADLMRHEAGLANLDTSLDMEDLFRHNIKQNAVGRVLESQTQNYEDAEHARREYHAITRGWIVNELFRRVDPEGRTIGEFLQQEISGPMQADAMIGVPEKDLSRMTPVVPLGIGTHLLESLKPQALGRGVVHNFATLMGRLIRLIPAMRKAAKAGLPPALVGMKDLGIFNEPSFAMGETPSANATCSARGLARVAAMLAARGEFAGNCYLSRETWSAMHDKSIQAAMGGMLITHFTQGGVDRFMPCDEQSTTQQRNLNEGREGFFGWMGLGGSIFQWHPELDIGFAFVPTSLHVLDLFNERGKAMQAKVVSCVANLPEQ